MDIIQQENKPGIFLGDMDTDLFKCSNRTQIN